MSLKMRKKISLKKRKKMRKNNCKSEAYLKIRLEASNKNLPLEFSKFFKLFAVKT